MDPQQIKHFIDAMAASDLAELNVSHDGWTLQLVRRPATAVGGPGPAPAWAATPDAAATRAAAQAATFAAASAPAGVPALPATTAANTAAASPAPAAEVLAPLYGVVHLQPEPGQPPFVQVGDAVRAGQVVCVIEAMKVFNQVSAERDGTVAAVLVASGQDVDAGQPLLRLA